MKNRRGQALVVLLVLMVIMVMVTSMAVVVVLVNSQNAARSELGNEALAAAESGAENALLMLLRDPYGYTGEDLTLPSGATVRVTVPAGNFPKTITSLGQINFYSRLLHVGVTYTNNRLGITSWYE